MNIIILHGTNGSPDGNWFPWLKEQCSAKGHKTHVPQFPTPDNQSIESWTSAFRKQAPALDENTILVGHSLGATMMLHVLEALKESISKSIFVAPVMDEIDLPEYDQLNKSFIKTPNFDWLTISNNAGKVTIFHGDNDPYVPKEQPEFLQDQIGGELKIIKNGGHLNTESGYTDFQELANIIY